MLKMIFTSFGLWVILLLMVLPAAAQSSSVPCELDPFCDDPDGPIEVPLDNGLVVVVIAGGVLGFIRLKSKKPGVGTRLFVRE